VSDFAVRRMRPSDEGFVYRAWLAGYWQHFPGRVVMVKSEFMARWHAVVERILEDPRTAAVVAHVDGEPDALLGFACGSRECLHWAYVKQAFRGLGICSACMDAIDASCGGIPCKVSHWPGSLPDVWKYEPELLRGYST
jgi:hypothetical protein